MGEQFTRDLDTVQGGDARESNNEIFFVPYVECVGICWVLDGGGCEGIVVVVWWLWWYLVVGYLYSHVHHGGGGVVCPMGNLVPGVLFE